MKRFYFLISALSLLFIISNIIIGLNKPLWLDEVASINLVTVPSWIDLLRNIFKGADTNPPLYFLLIFFIWKLTKSVIVLRLFSVGLSVAGLFSLLKFLQNFVSRRSIMMTLMLVSVSYFFSQYLVVEIRPYALFFLLTVLFLVQYYKISFLKKNNFINILSFEVITISLLYSHYFAIFYVIITLIFELVNKKGRNYYVIASIFISLLVFLPWLMAIKNQLAVVHGILWQIKPSFLEILKLPTIYFNSFLILIVITFSLVSIILKKPNFTYISNGQRTFLILILLFSIFPFLNITLTYLNISVSEPRYYIPSYISYIFILAVIFNLLELYKVNLLVIPLSVILFIYGAFKMVSYSKYQNQVKTEINTLLKLNQMNIPILCESPYKFYPLDFYAKKKNGVSNFYFVLDKVSDDLKGNVKNAIFDYYWNNNLKRFYRLKNVIPIENVINNYDKFYFLNESGRMIFEHRFKDNPSYLVEKEEDVFYIEKKETK